MTTTRTGSQPGHPDARPHNVAPPMSPLDIARHRLRDFSQGAHPDLFSPLDAVHLYNRLEHLEQRYDGLRRAAVLLLATLQDTEHPTQITGSTTAVVHLARAIDLTAKALNQP